MFNDKYKNKIRKIKALTIKEFFQIIRDSSSILIAVIFPIMLLFIYAYGVSLDFKNLKIGLVMQDGNPDAQSFVLSLRDSKFFDVDITRNKPELMDKLTSGDIHGIVTLPFYFTRFKKDWTNNIPLNTPECANLAPIYVVADGSDPNTAHFVQNYVLGAWANYLEQQYISNKDPGFFHVIIQPRFWYNEEINSRYFLLPGSIAIIMTLIGTLLTSLVIAREWERGTFEALIATPVTMREIYISKFIAYFLLGMGSMVLCFVLSVFIFGVPFRGSFLALTITSALFLLTALATGLLVSAVARNQFLASQIAIILGFLPSFMLSGFIFEIASMPKTIQVISNLMPAKYMVASLQTLFLAGNVWKLILYNSLIMIIMNIILMALIFTRKTKRLD
jgi:ABC-2 type transport system permease protein